MKPLAIYLLALLPISYAHAEKTASVCAEATTTLEINDCLADGLAAAEARLAVAFEQLLSQLTQPDSEMENYPEMRRQVSEAQAAWQTFRRADCDAKFTLYAGGSVRHAVFLQCMTDHTEQRITELARYFPL